MPTVSRQLVSIQYLRAAAAMMVVLFHMGLPLQRLGYPVGSPEVLSRGVDVFFVISGFIMWVTTSGKPVGPAEFYWRRIARIVPLYWLLTGVLAALLLAAPGLFQSGRFEPYHALTSFLFFPAVHPFTGEIQPLLIPGWTLNYEMLFYAIFGAALVLSSRPRMLAVWACLAAAVALGAAAGPSASVPVRFYGSSIVLEFGFGLLLGAAFTAGWTLPAPWSWALLLLGGLALAAVGAAADVPRVLGAGVPALAIVAGAVALERAGRVRELPFLHLLGDASYSLYLSHGIVLSACGQLARRAGLAAPLPGGLALFVLLACCAAVAASIALFLLVEKPLTRLLLARDHSRRASPAVVAVPLPARD